MATLIFAPLTVGRRVTTLTPCKTHTPTPNRSSRQRKMRRRPRIEGPFRHGQWLWLLASLVGRNVDRSAAMFRPKSPERYPDRPSAVRPVSFYVSRLSANQTPNKTPTLRDTKRLAHRRLRCPKGTDLKDHSLNGRGLGFTDHLSFNRLRAVRREPLLMTALENLDHIIQRHVFRR